MKKSFVTVLTISLLSFAAIGQGSINEYITLWYGDGVAEDAFAWAQAGGKCAVKFYPNLPPSVYPFIIVGGSVWIHPDFPNGQVIGSSFRIEVYDDDGVDGYPNTLLGTRGAVLRCVEE